MSNEYDATIRDMQKSIDEYTKQVSHWMKTAEKYSIEATLIKIERDTYLSMMKDVHRAVADVGPVPQYHAHVMRKHRAEWPKLWKAIDRILDSL
jgi:hypothetical protein